MNTDYAITAKTKAKIMSQTLMNSMTEDCIGELYDLTNEVVIALEDLEDHKETTDEQKHTIRSYISMVGTMQRYLTAISNANRNCFSHMQRFFERNIGNELQKDN